MRHSLASREQRLAGSRGTCFLQGSSSSSRSRSSLSSFRHLDLDARDQVAAAGALELRGALAVTRSTSILLAGLDLHRDRPSGRHLDGRTERAPRPLPDPSNDQSSRLGARTASTAGRVTSRGRRLARPDNPPSPCPSGDGVPSCRRRDHDRVSSRPALAPRSRRSGHGSSIPFPCQTRGQAATRATNPWLSPPHHGGRASGQIFGVVAEASRPTGHSEHAVST